MSSDSKPLSVLVTGGGIAGPCFAWWLTKGLETKPNITIVERAPTPRTVGQSIDIRRGAVDICKKMGLIDALKAITTPEVGTMFLNGSGKTIAKFMQDGNSGLTSEFEILRSDLANLFIEETQKLGSVNYVFGQRVSSLVHEESGGATVTFTGDLGTQHYDLVVGADGTMSSTRPAIHGADKPENFRFLGSYAAFFSIPYDAQKDEPPMWRWYNTHGGRHLSMRPHTNPKTTGAYMLYVKSDTKPDPEWEQAVSGGPAAQRKLLREKFADAGWEAERLLDGMDGTDDFYMTAVKQVKLKTWSKGCCTLVGDAAYGPSFFTGSGTCVAIEGAYTLAGEICKLGGKELPTALDNYEKAFRMYAEKTQDDAPLPVMRFANPQSKWVLALQRGILSFAYNTGAYKLAHYIPTGNDDAWVPPEYKWVSV